MRKLFVFALAAAAVSAAGISLGSGQARASTPTHTQRIVVRPVDVNGHPVSGYSVSTESIPEFTCDEGASPVAVNANIRFCGVSATYTVACWKSGNHTVLCLRNPRVKKLVRIHYSGSFNKVAAPKHPSPESMLLGNSAYCFIRDGGAWAQSVRHPTWVGFYGCTKNIDVYGPPSSRDGINRSHPLWTVHTIAPSGKGPATTRIVTRAYFVGTKFHV